MIPASAHKAGFIDLQFRGQCSLQGVGQSRLIEQPRSQARIPLDELLLDLGGQVARVFIAHIELSVAIHLYGYAASHFAVTKNPGQIEADDVVKDHHVSGVVSRYTQEPRKNVGGYIDD